MTNLTKQGMADGVRSSAVFILFLSQDVLQRPFVRFEVGEALKHKKRLRRGLQRQWDRSGLAAGEEEDSGSVGAPGA